MSPEPVSLAESVAAPHRLRMVVTRAMLVDVEPEEAARLLKPTDYMDVYDAASRFQRISAHGFEHVESDVYFEDAEDVVWYGIEPLDGVNGREKYLWSARHFVIQARTELSSGRYREGNCPELDAVSRDLAVIENRLMEMAHDAERQIDGQDVA